MEDTRPSNMGLNHILSIEEIRRNNILKKAEELKGIMHSMAIINSEIDNKLEILATSTPARNLKRKKTNSLVGIIPRKSTRMSKPVNYSATIGTEEALDDLNLGKKRRIKVNYTRPNRILKMPEEITQDELSNIASKLSKKSYDSINGTTCHQCRQKTLDTKSICRSANCVGVRGQFCGPCLSLRYGEDLKEALLDRTWSCPVCRLICNCSICRTKNGKIPTGMMINQALDNGYTNVKDFLKQSEKKKQVDKALMHSFDVTAKLIPTRKLIEKMMNDGNTLVRDFMKQVETMGHNVRESAKFANARLSAFYQLHKTCQKLSLVNSERLDYESCLSDLKQICGRTLP